MNALRDLTAEPRFRERKRGYDCDEVDHYVQTVAMAAAAVMQQIAEMQRRLEHGQGAGIATVDEASETMVRTLILAQKTADAAVAEAHERATTLTDEAQERADAILEEAASSASSRLQSAKAEASQLLAEAEHSSAEIISEAKRTAESEVAMERQSAVEDINALRAEIARLDELRASMQSRLENERARMRDHMAAFASFMEAVEAGRSVEVAPPPSGAAPPAAAEEAASPPVDSTGEASVARGQSPVPSEQAAAPSSPSAPAASDVVPDSASAPAALAVVPDSASGHGVQRSAFDDTVTDLPAVKWMDDTTAQSDIVDLPGALPPTQLMPAVSVEAPALFDVHGDEGEEFVDQLRRVVNRDSPAVASDEAMSAFFDQSDDDAGRRQSGRRAQPTGHGRGRGSVSPHS